MIFKFDRAGNMKNLEMEGDIEMARKNKTRVEHYNQDEEVNRVIQEVKEGLELSKIETAVGFQEVLEDEIGIKDEEDMVQREMKNDEIWDRGSRNGVVGDSVGDDENDKSVMSDEELKQKMRERNMGNVLNMNDMPTLSNKTKLDGNKGKEWEFSGVNVTMRDKKPFSFQLSLSVDQIAQLYESDKTMVYDPTLQRGCTYDKKDNMKPLITPKHVKKILSSMVDRTMIHGGEILLNYAKEYPTPISYCSETRTLTGNGALSICDGGHRVESCRIWNYKYRRNPQTTKLPQDFSYNITIFNLDHDQAEQLFVEANSYSKPISKTRIAFHDVFNHNRKLCDILESQSLLKGKIESVSNTIKKNSDKIITFKTLLDNVAVMKASTPREVEEIGLFLVEFWDELINLFPKSMGNVDSEVRAEQRKQYFVLDNMFMAKYFMIAKEIRDIENWKDKLKNLTEDNFMNRTNPIWRDILTTQGKVINTSSTNKIVLEKLLKQINK